MEKFAIDDRFDATVAEIEARLEDPSLYARLQAAMPGIRAIEPLTREDDGARVVKRVRYLPNVDGKIPSFGRAFVKPEMLSWIEESTYDKRAHRFDYRIVPNLPPAWRDRFDSRGSYVLAADGARATRRRIECEIHVRVPLFGGRIERMLRREVEANFRGEAAAMARWLAER
jgi:Protein of unknown function (DUF2505)